MVGATRTQCTYPIMHCHSDTKQATAADAGNRTICSPTGPRARIGHHARCMLASMA
eukprot:COSAG06_NODE_64904_length_258_cov_0.654088_1_plen_55_part_10